jgi:chromate transporter
MESATLMSNPLRDVTLLALKLGFTAFGGPAAHIAMLRHDVVDRFGWLSNQRFLDLLGVTNLIPGPNSTEMVMHIGRERAGWRGLVAAGAAFIVPAASITLLLAWLYVRYGTTTEGLSMMDGIKPVVLAVILQAVWGLGRTIATSPVLVGVGILVAILYMLGVNELLLLFGGAAMAVIGTRLRRAPASLYALALPGFGGSLPLALTAAGTAASYSGWQLFLSFLKIGSVLYGSGYVLIAFLESEFVDRLGWITHQQLLDAVAVGQFTPGPVFTTATFVGYLAGGWWGAILATIGIFLPAFVFVAVAHSLIDRLLALAWVRPVLDGFNAAAIGLILGVAVVLAGDAISGPWTALLAVSALALLIRFKVNSALLIVAGGALGLAASGL